MNKSFRNILGLLALALAVLSAPVTSAAINPNIATCRSDPAMDAAVDAAFAAGHITYAQWYAYHTYGEVPNMGPQEPPR